MGIRTKLSPLGESVKIIIPPSILYPFTEFFVGVTTISITYGGWFKAYIVGGGGNGLQHVNQYFVYAHGGGGSASMNNLVNATAGTGGAISVAGSTRNVQIQANGNAGTATIGSVCAGGASVYNGWGAGGASNGSPARGYVAIQQVSGDQIGAN